MLELRGASGGLAPLVQALPQTPIIGLRSAVTIRPPENLLIIRPLTKGNRLTDTNLTQHHWHYDVKIYLYGIPTVLYPHGTVYSIM